MVPSFYRPPGVPNPSCHSAVLPPSFFILVVGRPGTLGMRILYALSSVPRSYSEALWRAWPRRGRLSCTKPSCPKLLESCVSTRPESYPCGIRRDPGKNKYADKLTNNCCHGRLGPNFWAASVLTGRVGARVWPRLENWPIRGELRTEPVNVRAIPKWLILADSAPNLAELGCGSNL